MSWLRIFLLPLALLYGMVVRIRNLFFDWGILPSEAFSIPVISVGNLSAGGAGKTPHVEYLVRLLKDKYHVAVISRGYKRKTKGYVLAEPQHRSRDIGDEPLQIHKKFPDIFVAVCESRRKGIKRLLKDHPEINLVILDDAFQHRYVKPGLNLLLTGYFNPFFNNFLLPVGNLRDMKSRAKKADAVIVTKTPHVFSPLDRRFFLKKLEPYQLKKIIFSKLTHQRLQPLTEATPPKPQKNIKTIFLLTGIANPEALQEYLKTQCEELIVHRYPDHHQFSRQNLQKLRKAFHESLSRSKIIVTTEKDAMRLHNTDLQKELAETPVYYLPARVVFHEGEKKKFDRIVHRFLANYSNT